MLRSQVIVEIAGSSLIDVLTAAMFASRIRQVGGDKVRQYLRL